MSSKYLALTAIGTQIVLGLILVAILATLQGQSQSTPQTVSPIHVVVDQTPGPCSTWSHYVPGAPNCSDVR